MKMKSIVFLLLIAPIALFAQTQEQKDAPVGFLLKNTIIPPGPEAAGLGQYGNTPVSLYNGRVNISVPLHDVKGKETTLPISLSYSSGGVKVAEDPGWVGLGWTLSAGGVITRSVFGRPDKCANYYDKWQEVNTNVAALDKRERQEYYETLASNEVETQPDVYFFNVAGLSGKFYMDALKNIVQIDRQAIEITVDNICLPEPTFTIMGTDGTEYVFADRETTDLQYPEDGTSTVFNYNFVSSWYLTRMISRNKLDTVDFNYSHSALTPVLDPPMSQSISYTVHGNTTNVGGASPTCGDDGNGAGSIGPTTKIAYARLESLTYRDMEVEFNSVVGTSDFGGRRLTDVRVLISGSQYRKYVFEQGYFDAHAVAGDKRLRLDRIQIYGHSVLASPPYEFTYSNILLPSRTSASVDHWGYYNGASNSWLVPDIQQGGCTFGMGAERNTSSTWVHAGSLTGIKYPTGGSSEFQFGVHKKQEAHSISSMQMAEVHHPYQAHLYEGGFIATGPCQGNGHAIYSVTDLTIPESVTRVTVSAPGVTWDEQDHGEGAKAFTGIVDVSKFDFDGCDMFQWVSANYLDFEYSWFLEDEAWEDRMFSGLAAGNYKMIVISEFSAGNSASNLLLEVNVYQMELTRVTTNYPEILAGGLRVEKILDRNGEGFISSTREYEYDEAKTFGDPTYFTLGSYFHEAPDNQDGLGAGGGGVIEIDYNSWTITVSSSSAASLGTVLGSHVGYGSVKEKYTAAGGLSNGFKIYSYRNEASSNEGSFFGIEMEAYGRGDLLKEEFYNSEGTLLKEVVNEYALDVDEERGLGSVHGTIVFGNPIQSNSLTLAKSKLSNDYDWIYPINDNHIKIDAIHHLYDSIDRQVFKVKYLATTYFQNGHWTYLAKSTTTEYVDGQPFETFTENFYDVVGLSKPTRVEYVDSKDQVLAKEIEYLYGTDIPKKEIRYDASGNLLDGQEISYASSPSFPDKFSTSKGVITSGPHAPSLSMEERADYDYDARGNLIQYSKTSDVVQSFIWSDDDKNVIAEVTGAPSGHSAFTSFEDRAKGGWAFSVATTDTYIPTGVKCYNLSSGSVVKTGLTSSKLYNVSYRHRADASASVSGGTTSGLTTITESSGWKLTTLTITTTGTSVTISGTGLIDDLRLYPTTAQMISYTHDPLFGITSVTNASNKSVYYEYDDFGRLKITRDADRNIVKANSYNFKK